MTITEEQFTREHAEELCAFAIGPSGPDGIFILDLDGRAATEALSKNVATALATRLVELAAQLPEPPRILRRATDVDRHLRALDG